MNPTLVTVLIFVLLVWLSTLSLVVFRFYTYYGRLVKNGKKDSLPELLDELLSHQRENKKALTELIKKYDKLERDSSFHIQKVGLVRFNPFKDTGGDQSFILALVDGEDSGVIISSLHTRIGTRWYAKKVVKGKGVEYELSRDEAEALKASKLLN